MLRAATGASQSTGAPWTMTWSTLAPTELQYRIQRCHNCFPILLPVKVHPRGLEEPLSVIPRGSSQCAQAVTTSQVTQIDEKTTKFGLYLANSASYALSTAHRASVLLLRIELIRKITNLSFSTQFSPYYICVYTYTHTRARRRARARTEDV